MSSSFVDYEYTRPWPIYALGFKNSDINIKGKPHAAIAVGSFLKELENRVCSIPSAAITTHVSS